MSKTTKTKKKAGDIANLYARATTIHGFAYISNENPSKSSRIFWMIVVVLAISFTTFQMSSLRSQWKNNPVVTTLDTIALPIEEIEFPAVTICPQGSVQDILDNVLFKQFMDYLSHKTKNTGHDAREKRFASKEAGYASSTHDNGTPQLDYDEMITELKNFLKDVYPGAKDVPTKLVSLLASDNPKQIVQNEAVLLPSDEKECNEESQIEALSMINKQLGNDSCPNGFTKVQDLGCVKMIEELMNYHEASDYCANLGDAKVLQLQSDNDIKTLFENPLLGTVILSYVEELI